MFEGFAGAKLQKLYDIAKDFSFNFGYIPYYLCNVKFNDILCNVLKKY